MTDIPEIRGGGHLPMGAARNTWGRHAIDWTTVRMIEAMIIGIDTEIDDPVVGLIPANEPLTLEQAARAVGMKPSRARRLWPEPAVQGAYETAIDAFRKSQDPKNMKVCIEIRDPDEKARDRLKAIQVLEGAKPVAVTAITNHYTQNNVAVAPAGYVIRLDGKSSRDDQAIEGKTIEASPRKGNAGDFAKDLAEERAEGGRPKPSRDW